MSDTAMMPPLGASEIKQAPTVYFIDDSATMREVIKIAFRRENINVITCADAASALAGFAQQPPDVIITDVIMPDQDGYSVCSQIKQSEQFGKTPVILMSGVVNKSVADRAVAVQADELMRKPFQPQELISRVRNLLKATHAPALPTLEQPVPETKPAPALESLFAPPPAPRTPSPVYASAPGPVPVPPAQEQRQADAAWPRALTEAFAPQTPVPHAPLQTAHYPTRSAAHTADVQKLRAEMCRLELLVKKLQTELQIERQYNQALELHVKALTQIE